jgi:hypothetical protein
MLISSVSMAFAANSAVTTKTITAAPLTSKVLVNAAVKPFEAYTINGREYFKLDNLAYALLNTKKPSLADKEIC